MVVRESEELDLLVVDQQLGLAIIIENKIDAPEHGDQLDRYFSRVGERYPSLAVAGLFLTPQGTAPSDKRYLPVSYSWVCRAVEKVRDGLHHSRSPSALAPASKTTSASRTTSAAFNAFAFNNLQPQSREALALRLSHYIHLLRRHIVDHPELPDLCNELYQRHAPLLDLLFEHRGDDETRLYRAVQSLVSQGAKPRSPQKLVAKSPRKTIYPKFGLREWEALSTQANGGEPLERSALYFEFTLRGALRLNLLIGPYYDGKPALDALRGRVLLAARNRPDLFTSGPFKSKSPLEKTPRKAVRLQSAEAHGDGDAEPFIDADAEAVGQVRPNPTTTIIWRQTWISPKRFAALSHEEHVAELESRWQQFLDHDLPQLRAALPAQLLRTLKAKPSRPTKALLKPSH